MIATDSPAHWLAQTGKEISGGNQKCSFADVTNDSARHKYPGK